MRDIANNWPIIIPLLDNIEPLVDDFAAFRSAIRGTSERVTINGRVIPVHSLDVFTLLERIIEEDSVRRLFQLVLGVNTDSFFRSNTSFADKFILDFRNASVLWLNDLEADPAYANWTSDLEDLPLANQQSVYQIRRNLAHYVLYADPADCDIASIVDAIGDRLPVRFGFVPAFDLSRPFSRKVAFAFAHLARTSSRLALTWLIDSYRSGGSESSFAARFNESPHRTVDWPHVHRLFAPLTREFAYVRRANAYFSFTGVDRGTLRLNGRLCTHARDSAHLADHVHRALVHFARQALDDNLDSFYDLTLDRILHCDSIVVASLLPDAVTSAVCGVGLSDFPLQRQREFVRLLTGVQWFAEDEPNATSFWIHFGPESDAFDEFADEVHRSPARFARNPPQLRAFLGYAPDERVLIANGRVYSGVSLTDASELRTIDLWAREFVCGFTHTFQEALRTPLAHAVLSCLLIDWWAAGVTRECATFADTAHPALYFGPRTGAMRLELRLDPFSRDARRLLNVAHFLEDRGVVSLDLVLVPPPAPPPRAALECFFRADVCPAPIALDDTLSYAVDVEAPHAWIVETAAEQRFVLARLFVEGHCWPPAELAADRARAVAERGRGYFQMALAPGEFFVEVVPPARIAVASFAAAGVEIELRPFVTPAPIGTPSGMVANVLIAAGGGESERMALVTVLSVVRSAKVPVEFWILKRGATVEFEERVLEVAGGCRCNFVHYGWPMWLTPPAERKKAAALARVLFLDIVMPLSVQRVVAIEAGTIVVGDLTELLVDDMEGAPCAFVEDGKGISSALFVADMEKWRTAGVGEVARMSYEDLIDHLAKSDQIEELLLGRMQKRVDMFPISRGWRRCSSRGRDGEMAHVRAIGACGSIAALRRDMPLWRELDEEIEKRRSGKARIEKKK
jgi:UDP-glucose:glycoprotein glucosyltransferase